MKRSTDRILTTHAGSLPRPPGLLAMVRAKNAGEQVDEAAFDALVRSSVDEIVRLQVENGIDIVGDGEMSKASFNTYVVNRLEGFGGNDTSGVGGLAFADWADFPEWAADRPRNTAYQTRPMCIAPLSWKGTGSVAKDIDNLTAAFDNHSTVDAFMTTASIGTVAYTFKNEHYPTDQAYCYALADALKSEYEAIAAAGLVIQIDAPDAAMGRHQEFRNASLEDFRRALAMRNEALNHALKGIAPEQVRYHICWGNYEGPHTRDVALADIVDLVLMVNAQAYSIEASNPRHAHEWQVWKDTKLPEGKVLIPGVIDSTTNFVEHSEVVAQRLEIFAELVGRENVIAGTDCGFSTFAGANRVHPSVMWAKFRAMAEGARLASERLWRN